MLGQQRRQAGIRLFEPAAHGDSIGHVDESFGIHLCKPAKYMLAHEIRVQLRHAIDSMAADDGEVRHAYPPVSSIIDDRDGPLPLRILGIARLDRLQKIAIDQIDDLQMPRQQAFEHRYRPGLERLRQQSVVGVRKHVLS